MQITTSTQARTGPSTQRQTINHTQRRRCGVNCMSFTLYLMSLPANPGLQYNQLQCRHLCPLNFHNARQGQLPRVVVPQKFCRLMCFDRYPCLSSIVSHLYSAPLSMELSSLCMPYHCLIKPDQTCQIQDILNQDRRGILPSRAPSPLTNRTLGTVNKQNRHLLSVSLQRE